MEKKIRELSTIEIKYVTGGGEREDAINSNSEHLDDYCSDYGGGWSYENPVTNGGVTTEAAYCQDGTYAGYEISYS